VAIGTGVALADTYSFSFDFAGDELIINGSFVVSGGIIQSVIGNISGTDVPGGVAPGPISGLLSPNSFLSGEPAAVALGGNCFAGEIKTSVLIRGM
jgi:hypothetical protein